MRKANKISFSTSHVILLSFLCAILVGSLLLFLPISSVDGVTVSYIDALFTATTATCVTGLVTLPTCATWSIFGQVIILILIQIGGLGTITVMSGIMIAINRKMSMGDRMLIQDAFNLNTMSGLASFIKKVLIGTFIVEGIGAILYMTVFIPEFGLRGIWISVFNSVSAFCNAGIDIISPDSLCNYATNPIINLTTCMLIILGGIGYIVWWDIARISKDFSTKRSKCLKGLSLHTKIVLLSSVLLIFVGAALIFVFEYNNQGTIADMSLFDKIQVSIFQSITTRTAGFATIPQQNLTNSTSILCLVLMFVGGSPVGTAGGIKTVTVAVIVACAISCIRNKDGVTLFNRSISKQAINKAIAVISTSFAIMLVSTLLLSYTTDASIIDILYETVSATATVGLTRNLTATLNAAGKIIIILTMYLGRVGPISLAIAFHLRKENQNIIKNPTENISVG